MNREIKETVTTGKAAIVLFSYISIGATFYHFFEKMRWVDAYYFAVITLSTVGYGDHLPKTDTGKVFTIFYLILGLALFAGTTKYILKSWHENKIAKN
jgi:hypothetical protein